MILIAKFSLLFLSTQSLTVANAPVPSYLTTLYWLMNYRLCLFR
jgi:hypothetical protein